MKQEREGEIIVVPALATPPNRHGAGRLRYASTRRASPVAPILPQTQRVTPAEAVVYWKLALVRFGIERPEKRLQ